MKYSKFNQKLLMRVFKSTVLFSLCFILLLAFIKNNDLITGADQTNQYIPILKGKRVAVITNQSSLLKDKKNNYIHLVDKLVEEGINVRKIFAPEHGFRGKAGAGEKVENEVDPKTNLPIISLYGKNRKIKPSYLEDVDILLFDIQDVGVRFYTYISTLHYVMLVASKHDKPLIVLDRPNPNAHYIDGPVLDKKFKSFIGMHSVPIVYGMTIGEYARMINGENWLGDDLKCDLTVIPLKNYNHSLKYNLPISPSPNLPNSISINLYPSLCLFEGTNISVGRGTDTPFQIYGTPNLSYGTYTFTPRPNEGSKYPKHQDVLCRGENLENEKYLSKITLKWLIKTYKDKSNKNTFFLPSFFDKLAGTNHLRFQIEKGLSEKEIKHSWKKDLEKFRKIRRLYVLYRE